MGQNEKVVKSPLSLLKNPKYSKVHLKKEIPFVTLKVNKHFQHFVTGVPHKYFSSQ